MIDIIIYICIGLVLVLVVGFIIYMDKQFKCRLRVRDLINNRKIIKDYKVKEKVDNDGVIYWFLMGEKNRLYKKIPVPPEEAIEINMKGNKTAECYRYQTGDIVWIQDRNNVQEPPKDLTDKKEIKEWKAKNKVIDSFEPLTTKQRLLYINNMKKAEQRKGVDWKQQLIPLASLGALVLVIIAILIFGADIMKPYVDIKKSEEGQALANLEMWNVIKELKTDVQVVGSGGSTSKPIPD